MNDSQAFFSRGSGLFPLEARFASLRHLLIRFRIGFHRQCQSVVESAQRFRYAFPVDMVANKNKLGRRLLRLVITGGSTAMRDMPGFIIGAYSCPNPLDE